MPIVLLPLEILSLLSAVTGRMELVVSDFNARDTGAQLAR